MVTRLSQLALAVTLALSSLACQDAPVTSTPTSSALARNRSPYYVGRPRDGSVTLARGSAADLYRDANPPVEADWICEPTSALLGPKDIIDISVLGLFQPDVETVIRRQVQTNGLIDLPLLESPIRAEGLTTEQLRERLAGAYGGPPTQGTNVSVLVISRADQTASIIGMVHDPGAYKIPRPDFRLLDLLAMARDRTDGRGKYIYVIRAGGPATDPDDAPRKIAIDIAELFAGDPQMNILLWAGDVVHVPSPVIGQFHVLGNVQRPGVYDLYDGQMTVKQAIVAAGTTFFLPKDAVLIRRIGDTQEESTPLDIEAIFRGEAPDIVLKPDDVIEVDPRSETISELPADGDRAATMDASNAGVFYVAGNNRHPRSYELTGKMTVGMAVALDVGPDRTPSSLIRLVRRAEDGADKVFEFNYQQVVDGQEPDMAVQANDVVVIGHDAFGFACWPVGEGIPSPPAVWGNSEAGLPRFAWW